MILKRFVNETGAQPKAAFVFILIHIAIITTSPFWGPSWTTPYAWASKAVNLMDAGQMPYADFEVEYPPLGFYIEAFPRMIASSFSGFEWIGTIEALIIDLIGMVIIWALGRRLGLSFWNSSITYTLCLAVVVVAMPRFDIFPAIMTLAALYAFVRNWNPVAWALLAIAIMFKFYPAIIVPLFAICHILNRQYHQLFKGIAAFMITLAAIALPFVIMSAEGSWGAVTYHMHRGLGVESSYGSFLLLGKALGILAPETCTIINEYNSFVLDSSLADTLAEISFAIMIPSLLVVYALFAVTYRQTRFEGQELRSSTIVNYAILTLAVFMLTSKVFQPQYTLWLYMLIPLITGQLRTIIIATFFIATLPAAIRIMGVEYITELLPPDNLTISVMVVRSIFMVVMAFLLVQWKGFSRQVN